MRKKRGGVKTGDMVKKKYKMDKLDEYGNPTGKKFWKDFKGLVQNIDNEGNTTIYWYADKSTDVLTIFVFVEISRCVFYSQKDYHCTFFSNTQSQPNMYRSYD